jgi:putative redox protein
MFHDAVAGDGLNIGEKDAGHGSILAFMAVEISLVYQGQLRCLATHGPSGVQVTTDAPLDNCGRGESFSPTDLVAAALGACMLTIMGIVGDRHQMDLSGVEVKVEKHMVATPVRRIAALPVTISVPGEFSAEEKERLEKAALTCPVHQSLGEGIDIPVIWHWGS